MRARFGGRRPPAANAPTATICEPFRLETDAGGETNRHRRQGPLDFCRATTGCRGEAWPREAPPCRPRTCRRSPVASLGMPPSIRRLNWVGALGVAHGRTGNPRAAPSAGFRKKPAAGAQSAGERQVNGGRRMGMGPLLSNPPASPIRPSTDEAKLRKYDTRTGAVRKAFSWEIDSFSPPGAWRNPLWMVDDGLHFVVRHGGP